MKELVLIDGNSIMNRAFYGIMGSKMLTTPDGRYTNAVYGFLSIMFKIIDDLKPEYMVVTFDLKAPTARHKLYAGYKATRKGMPNEQHKWNITAGYVDFKDKSMKESASREIYEEIGIKIDPNAIKFVEYKDPDESCANLSLRFCCTIPENYVRDMIKNGSINSDTASRGGEKNEVEDIKLINIRDIDSYEWAFNHKSLIKYLYEKCKIMNKLFS